MTNLLAAAFALELLLAFSAFPAHARSARSARCEERRSPAELGIDLTQQDRCDPLVPERCLLPLPSDYYTVRDPRSRTGRRVAFVRDALPVNAEGTAMDPTELNTL